MQRVTYSISRGAAYLGIKERRSEEKRWTMVQITQNILKQLMLLSFITSFLSGIGLKYKYTLSNASDEASNKQFFQPRSSFFGNGVLQSSSHGEEVYYETLVHPGMFTHESPETVAIIGGGKGATLREVLKHNTVERVVMANIDPMLVNLSHEYLKSWNDCSDIVNSSYSCFDDPRVEMVDGNVVEKIFVNSSYDESALKFDVLIVDTQ